MGFFSWKTADTDETIANIFSGHENAERTVYLLQPNGEPSICEDEYEGYGVFGGVDVFEWLAEHNLEPEEVASLKQQGGEVLRDAGIDLAFKPTRPVNFPLKFSFNEDAVYEECDASVDCPDQGYFY
jgi:hypothetical protein